MFWAQILFSLITADSFEYSLVCKWINQIENEKVSYDDFEASWKHLSNKFIGTVRSFCAEDSMVNNWWYTWWIIFACFAENGSRFKTLIVSAHRSSSFCNDNVRLIFLLCFDLLLHLLSRLDLVQLFFSRVGSDFEGCVKVYSILFHNPGRESLRNRNGRY